MAGGDDVLIVEVSTLSVYHFKSVVRMVLVLIELSDLYRNRMGVYSENKLKFL